MAARPLLALLAVAGARAQAGEGSSYDGAVTALCTTASGAQPLQLTDENLVQTTGTKVQVTAPTSTGQPDAVWLTNEYSVIVAYQASPTLPVTLDFGSEALDLKLHVHYPSCYVTATNTSKTWRQRYDEWVSSDGATFSTDVFANISAVAKPTISNVNYNAVPKTATVSFTQPAWTPVPLAYVKDDRGVVLGFHDDYAAAPNSDVSRSFAIEIPAEATSVTACSLSCTSYDLTTHIVSSLEAASTLSAPCTDPASCAPAVSLNGEVLSVSPSAACSGSYTLYAETAAGADLAYGSNQALTVPVQGLASLVVKEACGGSVSTTSVDLAPLRTAYAAALAATTPAPATQNEPLTCTFGGTTYSFNDVWKAANGNTCMCVQGVAECGGGIQRGIFFDNAGIIGVCISVLIIGGACGGYAYHVYMQRKAQPRKSFSGNQYYGSSAAAAAGQQEIELPGGRGGMETSAV